jgi:hypothetical protein
MVSTPAQSTRTHELLPRRRDQTFWSAAGSKAPHRICTVDRRPKAVLRLRPATAVQNSCRRRGSTSSEPTQRPEAHLGIRAKIMEPADGLKTTKEKQK